MAKRWRTEFIAHHRPNLRPLPRRAAPPSEWTKLGHKQWTVRGGLCITVYVLGINCISVCTLYEGRHAGQQQPTRTGAKSGRHRCLQGSPLSSQQVQTEPRNYSRGIPLVCASVVESNKTYLYLLGSKDDFMQLRPGQLRITNSW